MGSIAAADQAGGTTDDVLWVSCMAGLARCATPALRAERLLGYLEVFPLGRHNRAVTEAIELCLDRVDDGAERRALLARLRALRDPHFPPIARTLLPSRGPSLPPI